MRMPKIEVKRVETFTGHKDCVYTVIAGAKEDEFISAGGDGLVVQWSLHKPDMGQLLAKMEQSVYALCYLPEYQLLAVAQNYEGIFLINRGKNEIMATASWKAAPIFDMLYDGEKLWAASGDGSILLFDVPNLQQIGHIRHSVKSARCLAYQPHLKHLAVGYSDHHIRIFNTKTGSLLHDVVAHDNSVFTLRYSADGQKLFSGSRDARLKVWGTTQYKEEESVVAHLFAINHLAISPSGSYMASCSMDKSIKLWEVEPLTLIKVIDKSRHAGHGTSVNKVLWGHSDQVLVSCSDDRSLSQWAIHYPEQ